MLNRRRFIQDASLAAGSILLGPSLLQANDAAASVKRLTILHTNDMHSRIDPFPMDGGRNQGLGGVAARAQLISEIRKQEENVLLLDAGDIFQGTPYFNFYHGEPELRAMSAMNYDAATIGNHDFDAGIENLALQVKQHARFPMLISNYDFTNTPMEYNYKPWQIIRKGGLKIGVFGIGIRLEGLVPKLLYGNTVYLDPVVKANETAARLKQEKCDLVVCLSHLGYKYQEDKISDVILAKNSENIDLIIGGHTHSFLDAPVVVKNKNNNDVFINQVGWGGIILGRLDYFFDAKKNKKIRSATSISVTKKSSE
jgi:5'-nucleotidase